VEVEAVARVRKSELLEEDLRQLAVVVLPGMDDDVLDLRRTKGDGERRRLNELRPISDDGEDFLVC